MQPEGDREGSGFQEREKLSILHLWVIAYSLRLGEGVEKVEAPSQTIS